MTWSVAPEAPERVYGPSWTEDPGLPRRVYGPSWTSPIERVQALAGTGTLTATVVVEYPPSHPVLNGSGSLTATVTGRPKVTAAFGSTGQLQAAVRVAVAVAANLNGSGSLVAYINDGLTATVKPGLGLTASFSGTGTLTDFGLDGLTAAVRVGSVGNQATVTAALGGAGNLTAQTFQADGLFCSVAGHLNAPITAALSGSGSLDATAYPGGVTPAPLTGTGSLTAAVVIGQYTVAMPLSGAGTLNAGVIQPLDGLVAAVYRGTT